MPPTNDTQPSLAADDDAARDPEGSASPDDAPVSHADLPATDIESAEPTMTTESELHAEPFDGDSLIPDDELAAAFAEVEHIEVAIEEEPAPEPEESPELDTLEEPPATQGRALRFKIGKKPAVAADSQPAPPDATGGADIVAVPVVSLGKRLYRATDAAFELTNRPFGFVSGGSRVLVGQIAIATIVVSALSAIAIPLVRSDGNAVAFVRERRADLEAQNPPRAMPASPFADPATDTDESGD